MILNSFGSLVKVDFLMGLRYKSPQIAKYCAGFSIAHTVLLQYFSSVAIREDHNTHLKRILNHSKTASENTQKLLGFFVIKLLWHGLK